MTTQTEQILENQLIDRLQKLGYEYVNIGNETDLINNLKLQLEKHNDVTFTDREFDRVMNILSKGSVFEKAKTLRQKQHIVRDNGDNLYFEFINTEHWCQNQYQVTNQVTVEGKYKNRYDVTLLINGLPLVQIELKRRGLELKEAFNQINRYQRHSFGANSALFQYVQIFVISNGVNTKYYANNRTQSFKQTFYWSDKYNSSLTNLLNEFTDDFLEPCHLSKMISKYIVLNESNKVLMILRPYQYYAVEAIVDKVKNSTKGGYIWHTTGSGKTLTSFKASQVIMAMPEVKKVVFVVDRKDLDSQTIQEFNSFRKDSVDSTDNTLKLVKQFADDTKLIVTTIQKLNTAINKKHHLKKMQALQDERIIFIFDECHRSQFGETHRRIRRFFHNTQFFGFTGTPIFAENAVKNELGKHTTKDLFGEALHKYVITDAIKDENVLKFSVEYVGRFRRKDSAAEIDIEVEDIDKDELMESDERLEKIVDYIIDHHPQKTHNREFNAVFAVNSINTLMKYYELFKRKKNEGRHNLKIATIFSYQANEDDADATGVPQDDDMLMAADPLALYNVNNHSREKLDAFIDDYNKMFGTGFSTKDTSSFYKYYEDISKKVKERQVDIMIVVNMFLTGFDSKTLNTLYVDKNLKYHGLIQAYSRTNRVLNEKKSQGNIVVFRNLKQATDDAITLFSNKDAIDVIIMKPYEDYVQKMNDDYDKLIMVTPTVESVDDLKTEDDELKFITAFRQLMRTRNVIITFADFKWLDLNISEQEFEDFKSKYLDLYEKVKLDHQPQKASVLNDVDFELELIHRDEINVKYIISLLMKYKADNNKDDDKIKEDISKLLAGEKTLRSKKELIEKFIEENLPKIEDIDTIPQEFDRFWSDEEQKAFIKLVEDENLNESKTKQLIENYLFAQREPIRDEVLSLIEGDQPSVLQRKKKGERIMNRIKGFIETFIEGITG